MDPVVHFEMPYADSNRVVKFYQEVFGWNMQPLGDAMNGYVLATTTEMAGDLPKNPGAINGGLFPRKPDRPAQHPLVVIAVDDIERSMKKVTGAGGKVFGQPMDIPGVGKYVAFSDSEGNDAAMLHPLPRRGATKPK